MDVMFVEERRHVRPPHMQPPHVPPPLVPPPNVPPPLVPFRCYRYGTRSVHTDGCVKMEAAYDSVPPSWLSERVSVQWNDVHVRVVDL